MHLKLEHFLVATLIRSKGFHTGRNLGKEYKLEMAKAEVIIITKEKGPLETNLACKLWTITTLVGESMLASSVWNVEVTGLNSGYVFLSERISTSLDKWSQTSNTETGGG